MEKVKIFSHKKRFQIFFCERGPSFLVIIDDVVAIYIYHTAHVIFLSRKTGLPGLYSILRVVRVEEDEITSHMLTVGGILMQFSEKILLMENEFQKTLIRMS